METARTGPAAEVHAIPDRIKETTVDTRQLGTTDLHITPIGFGAWAIGGPDYAFG